MSKSISSSVSNSVEDADSTERFLVKPQKPLTNYQKDTLRRAASILETLVRDSDVLSSPDHVRQMIKCHVSHLDYEVFGVIHLDTRHRMLSIEILSKGTIDCAAVYPREIIRSVMHFNSAAILIFHNHPSRDGEPSSSDIRLTPKIVDALGHLDVRVLDHLVAAGDTITSLAERGLM